MQTFENGIKMAWHIHIYMGTSRHFYIIFDIRVFDLNVPIKTTNISQDKETFLSIHILQHFLEWKIVTEEETVLLVCYSPPKRKVLQTAFEKKSPIKIQANLNTRKRLNTDSEEYAIPKNAKVTPSKLEFSYNKAIDDDLHSVQEALEANVYTSVDLKVKIITKELNKQLIVKNAKTTYKCDTTVADHTNSIKLVLWEHGHTSQYFFGGRSVICPTALEFPDSYFVIDTQIYINEYICIHKYIICINIFELLYYPIVSMTVCFKLE